MRRVVYAFILIIILAFLGSFPAYLAMGQGGSQTATVTVTAQPAYTAEGGGGEGEAADTTPPTISDILLSIITKTSADISWRTNEASTSQVEYWSGPSKLSPLDTAMVIYHLVHLTDLTPGTTYYYRTMSRDAAGNLAVSDVHTFVILPGAAIFTSSRLSISPSEVYTGETVTISVLITNTGDGAGSYGVSLKIDGKVEATKEVTLNPGASEQVSFSIARDTAGTYSVDVNGLTGAFVVKKPVSPVTPVEPTLVKPINWWLIGGIIAAVAIMVLAIFLLRRRMIF